MTKVVTAAYARKLAGVPDEKYAAEVVAEIESKIEKAATDKKRVLELRDQFWSRGGYDDDPTWKTACDLLRQRGFAVDFFYEERQFVDMGTIIRW